MNKGANIEAQSNLGWTPLICASIYGHSLVARVTVLRATYFSVTLFNTHVSTH